MRGVYPKELKNTLSHDLVILRECVIGAPKATNNAARLTIASRREEIRNLAELFLATLSVYVDERMGSLPFARNHQLAPTVWHR